MVEGELPDDRSERQKAWDEYSRPLDRNEILGGRDPREMTDEEIDWAYNVSLARKLELVHQLFRPASPEDLRRRLAAPYVIARSEMTKQSR